jgi:hypothetical protein
MHSLIIGAVRAPTVRIWTQRPAEFGWPVTLM